MKTSLLKAGDWFTGYIEDIAVQGRIQKTEEGNTFFCQNEKNGTPCGDRFGYEFSWIVLPTDEYTERQGVHNITIFKRKPKKFTYAVNSRIKMSIATHGAFVYPKVAIKVGCQLITPKKILSISKALGRKKLEGSILINTHKLESPEIIRLNPMSEGYTLSIFKGVGIHVKDRGLIISKISFDEVKEIVKVFKKTTPVATTKK